MSTDVFVDFRDAAFTYDGEAFVFRHLNLTVPQGQFLCLLGGNGSGKSTLAKHINALLLPDEGEVVVFGCDTRDAEQTYFIRSNAGLVFQNPDDQLVASLIENDVAFGPENLGIQNPELHERGMTVVMITHFMEEAAAADRVVVLDGGEVRMDGAPEEVLVRADELRSLSLEVPFACRLSLELQAAGVPVSTCITDDTLKEELCALRSKM